MLTVLASVRRFQCRPSEALGISDSYTAWCFDEAVLYLLSQIEEKGEIPDLWQKCDNKTAVAAMLQRKGVIFNDRRRNDKCKSDT